MSTPGTASTGQVPEQAPVPSSGPSGTCSPGQEDGVRVDVFPTTPVDADILSLDMPCVSVPEDPAGVGPVAYAVHVDQLGSTRAGSGSAPVLEDSAIDLLRAALRLTSSLQVPEALRRLVESACSVTGAT